MTVGNTDKLTELVNLVSPNALWQIKKGHGSFVTMDFGDKIKKIRKDGSEYFSGQYHLWIYNCGWTLKKNEEIYLSSDLIDSDNSVKLNDLEGMHLLHIHIESGKGRVSIKLSGGFVFELFPEKDSDPEDDFFIFYDKTVATLSYSPKEGIYIEEQFPT